MALSRPMATNQMVAPAATGANGGLSFRSGAGQMSFRVAQHTPLTAAVLFQAASAATGNACFRPTGGCASFRTSASTVAAPPAPASRTLHGSQQDSLSALPASVAAALAYVDSSSQPLLRSGYSNGHSKGKRNVGAQLTKGPLHSGLAYGGGGTGSAGGLSFRSGGGQTSFKGPRHAPLTPTVAQQASHSASGSACFRATGSGGCASFRPAAATAAAAALRPTQHTPLTPSLLQQSANAANGTAGFRAAGGRASFRSTAAAATASSGVVPVAGAVGGRQGGHVSHCHQDSRALPSSQQDSRAMPPVPALGYVDGSSQPMLRSGHSNGHSKGKRNVGTKDSKGQLHSGLAYGSGGAGSAGGLSFRSGGGQISFRGPQHAPMTPAAAAQAASGASGSAGFRSAGGCASFRPAAAAAVPAPVPAITVASAREAGLPLPTAGAKDGNALSRMLQQLQSLGLAGVVAYGLLNTIWYTATFMTVWLVTQVPRGQGALIAAKSFLTVMAVVWAGSQVTKVARAAGALLLAPIVDKGLDWMQARFKFETKQQAFMVVLGSCITLALLLFGSVVLAWA